MAKADLIKEAKGLGLIVTEEMTVKVIEAAIKDRRAELEPVDPQDGPDLTNLEFKPCPDGRSTSQDHEERLTILEAQVKWLLEKK